MSSKGADAQTEFCLEYQHDGSTWGLDFFAVDLEDAIAKVESIKRSLVLLGRLSARVPCSPELGMMVEAREAAQNPPSDSPPVH